MMVTTLAMLAAMLVSIGATGAVGAALLRRMADARARRLQPARVRVTHTHSRASRPPRA